jgi:hypothetical protein
MLKSLHQFAKISQGLTLSVIIVKMKGKDYTSFKDVKVRREKVHHAFFEKLIHIIVM